MSTLSAVADSPTVNEMSPEEQAAQQVPPQLVGPQQVLLGGLLHSVKNVDFIMGKRRQHLGKDRHQNEEQDDDSAERPQRFLLEKPDEEIHQSGTPIGRTDGGGCLCGIAHIKAFRARDYSYRTLGSK